MHSARAGAAATYLPALDGLRALSIALVVLSHLGLERVLPGAFGVTLFFFISGYLITRQLASRLSAGRTLDFARFYVRRALRLVPASAVYCAVAGGAYVLAGGRISLGGWGAAMLYGANYYDLWAGYHSNLAGVRHPFNILWSLAIEEHFYLIWPVALALLWRRGWAVAGLVAVCALVLLWRLYLLDVCFGPHAHGVCGPANPNPLWRYNRLYLATDTRLDSIAWGALLAMWPADGRPRRWRLRGRVWAGVLLLGVSFVLPGALGRYTLRPSLQGFGLLLMFPVFLDGEWLAQALSWRGAVLLGRLSYSLYLWHWGALGVADDLVPLGGVGWLVVAVGLSAGLTGVSYWGVERPMLRLRRRFGSHISLALAPVSAPVGAATLASVPSRRPERTDECSPPRIKSPIC